MSVTVRGILRKAIRGVDNEMKNGTFTEGLAVLDRLKKEHIDVQQDDCEKVAMRKMLKSLKKSVKSHLGIQDIKEVPVLIEKRVSINTSRKPDKEISTVKCVFVCMTEDCSKSDLEDIGNHGLKERNRKQFTNSISIANMKSAGIKEGKNSLQRDETVGMYWCLVRGIFHQILTIKDKQYLFVSEKYKY